MCLNDQFGIFHNDSAVTAFQQRKIKSKLRTAQPKK